MRIVTLEKLEALVEEILARVALKENGAFLITLSGDLGAGKTTLTQFFAKALGVEESVQSPTYVLMKSYPIAWHGFERLVHIDAYRLDEPVQFGALKPEMVLGDAHAIVILEWPERVEGQLPNADIAVTLSSEGRGEGERSVEII